MARAPVLPQSSPHVSLTSPLVTQRFLSPLYDKAEAGSLDPSSLIEKGKIIIQMGKRDALRPLRPWSWPEVMRPVHVDSTVIVITFCGPYW